VGEDEDLARNALAAEVLKDSTTMVWILWEETTIEELVEV